MNYLDLPKPHGWLLWRGKKKAIANDTPLSSNTLLVVSGDEAYGYVTLASPVAVNVKEFERLEDEHLVRREDRKLLYPQCEKLYLHRLKEWTPFESTKQVKIENGQAELLDDVPLTPEQLELIKQAERLPKTLILLDEAVTLCDGKAIYCEGVTTDKLDKILDVTLDGVKSVDDLPLYQLALVRIPRLSFKQKKSNEIDSIKEAGGNPKDIISIWKSDNTYYVNFGDWAEDESIAAVKKVLGDIQYEMEAPPPKDKEWEEVWRYNSRGDKAMPYAKVKRGDEWCVIQTDTEEIKKCYEGEDAESKADDLLASLRINVESEEGKSVKELIAEARKCYDSGMAIPVIINGPTTFTELEELDEIRQLAYEMDGLNFQFRLLSENILSSSEVANKGAALSKLANEYSNRVSQVGSKELEGLQLNEDDLKAGKRVRGSMMAKVKQAMDWLKEFMDWAEPQDEAETMAAFGKASHFDVKQVNGIPWFFAHSANAFEDREGEIFSTKSLEKYVAEAEKKGDRGYFNLWHIGTKQNPSLTDFARIEWQGVVGKFLVEAGPFLDNEPGQAALKFFSEYPDSHPDIAPEGWGSSVEYKYLPSERKTGIYENIWKTRTSTLPRKAAANTWTKGTIMALSPEQTKAAVTIFGESLASQIIKGAEGATKELEEAGVANKEVTTETTTEVVKEVAQLDESAIVEKVAKQVGIDFQPIAEALTLIADNQNKQQLALDELAGRIKSLEKTEDVKTSTETPRFMVSLVNRASQAEKTIVADDDELKNKKPVETQPVAKSGAAAFFPAR